MSIISGPPGPRPEQLLERIPAPLLVLWGDRDTFTPIDGPVGRYFRRLPDVRQKTRLQVLPGRWGVCAWFAHSVYHLSMVLTLD